MRHVLAPIAAALAFGAGPAAAGPHEHGVGDLQVAADGKALSIELRLPAKDLIGYERTPRNDAERTRMADARAALADPRLFSPSPDAKCAPSGVPTVQVPMFGGAAGSGDDHADFEASYRFECANPAALTSLEHGVFKAFPRIKQLKAQAATAKGQKQTTLTHGRPRLSL